MRKIIIAALGIVLGLVLLIVIAGYALPVEHVASAGAIVRRPPDQVFAVIAHFEDFPRWRTGVYEVEVLAREPRMRWREHGDDSITYERVETDPPRRLVTRIDDPDLPFGGRWTFELEPDGDGTRLTITEHGEVYNPLFRFFSRFVFGHTATIEQFLEDLQARLPAS